MPQHEPNPESMTTPRRAAAAKKEMEGALTTAFKEHREAFTKVFKRSAQMFTRGPMWQVKDQNPGTCLPASAYTSCVSWPAPTC